MKKNFLFYLESVQNYQNLIKFETYIYPNISNNKKNEYQRLTEIANKYTSLQKILIHAWGRILYMSIPKSTKHKINIKGFVKQYLKLLEEDNLAEIDDWVGEGDGCVWREENNINKKKYQGFNREILIDTFNKASKKTKTKIEIIVKRSGKIPSNNFPYVSCSLSGGYTYLGEEKSFVLPIGTEIIWCTGVCDDGEILVKKENLKQSL
jgi:hypothetical protein